MKKILSRYLLLAGVAVSTIITLKYCSQEDPGAKLNSYSEDIGVGICPQQGSPNREEETAAKILFNYQVGNYQFNCSGCPTITKSVYL